MQMPQSLAAPGFRILGMLRLSLHTTRHFSMMLVEAADGKAPVEDIPAARLPLTGLPAGSAQG